MAGILTARIVEACAAVAAGTQARLLAEPEFADGTISHRTLLDRVARTTPLSPRCRYDLEAALLRLAPGADDAFWAQWTGIDPGSADTARRAYRETLPTLTFELIADGPNWPTAAAREALADPAGPGPASHSWRLLAKLTSPALAEHGRHGQAARMGYRVRWDEIVAAWPLLAPHQPELIAAHLLRPLSDGLEPGRSAATVAVNCLAPACSPVRPGRPLRSGHRTRVGRAGHPRDRRERVDPGGAGRPPRPGPGRRRDHPGGDEARVQDQPDRRGFAVRGCRPERRPRRRGRRHAGRGGPAAQQAHRPAPASRTGRPRRGHVGKRPSGPGRRPSFRSHAARPRRAGRALASAPSWPSPRDA